MLPMLMLQTSDTAIFNTEPSSAGLVPPGATEPQVEFSDILRLGTELVLEPEMNDGQLLPAGGNALPIEPSADESGAPADAAVELVLDAALNPLAPPPTLAAPTASPTSVAAVSPNPLALEQAVPMPAAMVEIVLNASPADRPVLDTSTAVAAAIGNPAAEKGQQLLRPGGQLTEPLVTRPVLETLPAQETRGPVQVPIATGNENHLLTDQLRGSARTPSPQGALAQLATALDAPVAIAAENKLSDLPRELRSLPPSQPVVQAVQPQLTPTGPVDLAVNQQTQPGPLQINQALPQQAADSLAPSAQASQPIQLPVKDAAWGDQLGQRVQLMANNRLQSAEIRLTPAELGPLRIQVSVDDGATNVTFHAQHAVTREAIEQALPRLRELLAENGLTLDQTNVSDQGVTQGERERGDGEKAAFAGNDAPEDQDAVDLAIPQHRARVTDGLVDTFA